MRGEEKLTEIVRQEFIRTGPIEIEWRTLRHPDMLEVLIAVRQREPDAYRLVEELTHGALLYLSDLGPIGSAAGGGSPWYDPKDEMFRTAFGIEGRGMGEAAKRLRQVRWGLWR